ncbi:MAG: PQQ-binding-like beta-propeller repeat protein [Betaproteobacteria bacterium]
MHTSNTAGLVASLFAFMLLGPGSIAPAGAYDWRQFGGNAQHNGNNAGETTITKSNVSTLIQKYQVVLPGSADGAPVFVQAVATTGGVKDLLFVTTRDARIVALDAQTGAVVWSRQYNPAGCQINNSGPPCYTTSSPAIDPNRVYVYTYGLDGYVHKLAIYDGGEVLTGGWPQLTTLKGFNEKGSSALSTAPSGGTRYLYVVHSGYPGDNGDYQGHVTAIDLSTGAQQVFNAACSDQAVHLQLLGGGGPTCAQRQNGIWSRPGVVYDAGTDRILLTTGNAFTGGAGRFDGTRNWSETVIALNPNGSGGGGGMPLDSYTPSTHGALDDADADIGSTAPAILPVPALSNVQHLAVQGGKDRLLRLLNLQNLSGQGGPGNVGGEIGVIDIPQGGMLLSQPAVWINPSDGSTWIFVVNSSGAAALRVDFDGSGNPSLSTQWQNGQNGTSPIVANGMVFLIAGSNVRALDALTGAQLWSLPGGGGIHWQSAIVANGVVYATDQAARLSAFGLPAPPSSLVNTGFETPSLGSGYQYGPVSAGVGWTFSSGAGIQGNASAWGAAAAPQGTQTAFLQSTGSMAQTLALTAGTYTLSFSAAQRPCCVAPYAHPIVVKLDGTAIGPAITPTASSFSPFALTFSVAPTGAHTLSFASSDGSDRTTFIDTISLNSGSGSSLVNGGFEAPALGSGYQYGPTGTGIGWVFTPAGGIQGNGSAWGAASASEGTQTAFLQSTATISQTLLLNAGNYTLSFNAAQRACCVTPFAHPITILLDGVAVGNPITPASTTFSPFAVSLTIATTGAHVIAFTSSDGNDRSVFIDAVTLTAQ